MIDYSKITKTSTDFDYAEFYTAQDQQEYLKNYMYNLVKYKSLKERYFLIKIEMRNLNWKALSKQGMLQEKFIVSQFTVDQLIQHQICDSYNYLPIKIFHYLIPELLCKYHNLSIVKDWKNEFNQNSYNSLSSQSSITNEYTQIIQQQPFYEYFINIINEDLEQYLANEENKLQLQETIKDNVNRYDFIETQDYNDEDYDPCKYTKRLYDYMDNENIKSTMFQTYQRKYIGKISYHYLQLNRNQLDDITVNENNYITNSLRKSGVSLMQLIQNQNINLKFAKKYYDIKTICRYYKFTEQQLLINKSLISNYLSLIFKYNHFDTNNSDFKVFFNYCLNNNKINNEVKKIFITYQIFDDTISPYSSLKNEFLSLYNYKLSKPALKNDDYFDSSIILNQYSIFSNYHTIKEEDSSVIVNVNNQFNSIEYSDNIIMTNCSIANKIKIINSISYPVNIVENGTQLTSNSYIYRTKNNNTWENIQIYNDEAGQYINLYTKKYNNMYTGVIQDTQSIRINFHTPSLLQIGENTTKQKYSDNRDYFVVGTEQFLIKNYCFNIEMLVQVKVYIKDIIAVLENKCLAVSKVYM